MNYKENISCRIRKRHLWQYLFAVKITEKIFQSHFKDPDSEMGYSISLDSSFIVCPPQNRSSSLQQGAGDSCDVADVGMKC